MLMRRTYFFRCFRVDESDDSAVATVQINPAASRTNKGVSPLESSAFIMASRLQIPTKCCIRHDGSAELVTFASRTTSSGPFKTNRFRRNTRNTISGVPTKAIGRTVYINVGSVANNSRNG